MDAAVIAPSAYTLSTTHIILMVLALLLLLVNGMALFTYGGEWLRRTLAPTLQFFGVQAVAEQQQEHAKEVVYDEEAREEAVEEAEEEQQEEDDFHDPPAQEFVHRREEAVAAAPDTGMSAIASLYE